MSPSSGPGQRWAEAWSAHDVEALSRLFTEDCEYEDVAFGIVNPGHEGVLDWARGFLGSFPDLRVTPRREFKQTRLGVLEWEMEGTQLGEFDGRPPGGGRFRVRGVTIFEFEGERIRRCADYWNLGDVHTQLETSSRA